MKTNNKIFVQIISFIGLFTLTIMGVTFLPIFPFKPQLYQHCGMYIKLNQSDFLISNQSIINVLIFYNIPFWVDSHDKIRIPIYIAFNKDYVHNLTQKSMDDIWQKNH